MLEEGSPDLPLFAIPVLIGDRAAMEVKVKEVEYQDFENMEIAPSKGNFSREIDPDEVPFRYGEVYAQNRFFPDNQAQLDEPYILRDSVDRTSWSILLPTIPSRKRSESIPD